MEMQLQGLWTIQDFWIGHHNLLMRRDDVHGEENLDLRFEGTSLFIGNTAIYEPTLSVIGTERVPPWIQEAYQKELFGREVFHLFSRTSPAGIYIAADILWSQRNSLPKSASSLRGKYEWPRTIHEVEQLVQEVVSGEKKEQSSPEKWERLFPPNPQRIS